VVEQGSTAFRNSSELLKESSADGGRSASAKLSSGKKTIPRQAESKVVGLGRAPFIRILAYFFLVSITVDSEAGEGQMKELIEAIAKALVDNPDQVSVRAVEGEQVTVLELRVHPSDLGKVIGKQGRTARSIRTILNAAGMKLKKRFTLEILE
jgi:predicted RNA-binding protein YlqC (UPF0109 family)